MNEINSQKEIQKDFVALLNSCVEGFTGEWDHTTGPNGFVDMYSIIESLAEHYKIDISSARPI
jgi:hypothetical protein